MALVGTSCQTTRSTRPEPVSEKTPYVLSGGDVVTVTFTGAPELDQEQKIRSDGKLNLPLVGEVVAAGKSLAQLQQNLTRLYKSQLQGATVLVGLKSTSAAVYVSGAVGRPAKIPLDRPMTALEAIMEAGGFTSGLANPRKVILIREEKGQHQTQLLDLSPALRGETTGVFYLRPYDMLIVQEKMF